MKKPLLTLLVLPIMLTSCSTNRSSFDALKARIDTIEDSAVYPYYKVIGSIDFNNEYMEGEPKDDIEFRIEKECDIIVISINFFEINYFR